MKSGSLVRWLAVCLESIFMQLNVCVHLLCQVAYSLVQSGVLVLLMARFIMQASFQPKLSVIAGTLVNASAEIAYYIIILVVVSPSQDTTPWLKCSAFIY